MQVLILGFNDYERLDSTMQKLIEDNQCYLFTVLCGGADSANPEPSLAEQWATANGCPMKKIYNKDIDKLLWILGQELDYLVMEISETTPQILKNFMMRVKSQGKHGTIVRKE